MHFFPLYGIVLKKEGNGMRYIGCHLSASGGYFNMKIHQMVRTKSGWLTPLPLSYRGEAINKKGYDQTVYFGNTINRILIL